MSALLGGGGGSSSSGRIQLTTTTNFYVATTGNDGNNGSIGAPWLTIQHAVNVLSEQYDIGAQNVFINIGAGLFDGFGIRSMVGGGYVSFIGAGSANTTIQGGTGADVSVNEGETISCYFNMDTIFIVNKVTLLSQSGARPTGATMLLDLYLGGTFLLGADVNNTDPADMVYDMTQQDFSGVYNAPIFVWGNNASCTFRGADLGGTHTFETGGGTFTYAIWANNGGMLSGDGGHGGATTIVINGSPTFTKGFLVLADGASADMFINVTGTMTGAPFNVDGFGAFNPNSNAGWFQPALGPTLPAGTFSEVLNCFVHTSGFYTGLAANFIRGVDSPTFLGQVWLGYGTNETIEWYDALTDKDYFAAYEKGLKVSGGIGIFGWTNHAKYAWTGAVDVAFSRSAAGIAALGTSDTIGDNTGALKLTNLNIQPVAVGSLPAAPAAGDFATVNDALAPVVGTPVAAGGAAFAAVCYNGAAWNVFSI